MEDTSESPPKPEIVQEQTEIEHTVTNPPSDEITIHPTETIPTDEPHAPHDTKPTPEPTSDDPPKPKGRMRNSNNTMLQARPNVEHIQPLMNIPMVDEPTEETKQEPKARSRGTNNTFIQTAPKVASQTSESFATTPVSPNKSEPKTLFSSSSFGGLSPRFSQENAKRREIIKSGSCEKLGEKVKNWQTRYFILFNSGELEYYKGVKEKLVFENQGNAVKEVSRPDMSKSEKKGAFNVAGCTFKYEKSKGHDYCIVIQTEGRDFVMSCKNDDDLLEWKKAFRGAGGKFNLPDESLISGDESPVQWSGTCQKLGEKVKKWSERFFVLYKNGNLEYYSGIKGGGTLFPDLKTGILKGKFNILGKFFKTQNANSVIIELEEREFMISLDETLRPAFVDALTRVGAQHYDATKKFSGFAQKLGEKSKAWQDRFFVVAPNGDFEYYSGLKPGHTDVSKGTEKGRLNVKDKKFRCVKGVKHHDHVICIIFEEREFLMSFKTNEEMMEWKCAFNNSGAHYNDPNAPIKKIKAPNPLAELIKKTNGRRESIMVQVDKETEKKALKFGHLQKLGELSSKWQERYFVIWSNGDLEYYKGVKWFSTDMADLSQADLKGRINLTGLRFRVPREITNVNSYWNQMHVEMFERELILAFRTPEIMLEWNVAFQTVGCAFLDPKITITMGAFAEKLGEKVKSWQERYMVLFSNGELEYYKGVPKPKDHTQIAEYKKGEAKGTFSIYGCRFKPYESSGHEFGYEIELKTGRALVLSFNDEPTAQKFKASLSETGAAYYDSNFTSELNAKLNSSSKILFYGYIDKLGEKVKNFKTRYFVMHEDGGLEYYKGVKQKNAKEMAKVKNAVLKGKVYVNGCSFRNNNSDSVIIHLKNGRDFCLQFKDKDSISTFQNGLIALGCFLE
jgi:hypothetical protein